MVLCCTIRLGEELVKRDNLICAAFESLRLTGFASTRLYSEELMASYWLHQLPPNLRQFVARRVLQTMSATSAVSAKNQNDMLLASERANM